MKPNFKWAAALFAAISSLILHADSIGSKNWEFYYNRAKVATFYSSTVLNGYDELKLANLYVDSSLAVQGLNERQLQLSNDLKEELAISENIAADNVNYIYPSFSLLVGHRPDFVYRDEPSELLAEGLLEKVMELNDPINKGALKANTDFVLVTVEPFDQTLFTVASDFLGVNTGHYCIRAHEIKSILDPEGYERYQNAALTDADWELICEAYSIDKIIHLGIKDQGSIIENIHYKGLYLGYFEIGKGYTYTNYFEAFRVNKSESWLISVIISIFNALLAVIGLFIISSFSFSKKGKGLKVGKWKLTFGINSDISRDALIVLVASVIFAIGSHYISASIAPDINAFYQEPGVKLWVASQISLPFIFSCIGVYLVLFRLPKLVVNTSVGYSRIIYASFIVPSVLLSYYEYQAELFPEPIYKYLIVFPFIWYLFVSTLLGKIFNNIFKGNKLNWQSYVSIVVNIGVFFGSFYAELKQDFLLANIGYSINGVLAIVFLYFDIPLVKKPSRDVATLLDSEYRFGNPFTYFMEIYSKDATPLSKVIDFIRDKSGIQNILFIQGSHGVGKTRLSKEVINFFKSGENVENSIFIGDCNDVKDGSSIMYEPLYEAFCLNGEVCRSDIPEDQKLLDRGFFTDRSQLSKGLTSLIATAGAVGPVDLSAVLSVEDTTSRSVKEIAAELVDILIQKYLGDKPTENSITIIIDDFQKCDSATVDLLHEVLRVIRTRSKFTSAFKFIIIHTHIEGNESEKVSDFKEFYKTEMSSIGSEDCLGSLNLVVENQNQFIDSVITSSAFKVHPEDGTMSFGPFLKGHIEKMASSNEITPGDLFSYLEALENSKYIEFDGSVIRLRKEPEEGELKIHDSRRGLILESYLSLPSKDQSLLESAASIGFKFDAELLAQIWHFDLLDVISTLEVYEGVFVKDQNNEDNIFSFIDKVTHDVILQNALKKRGNDETRQLIVEYQKRIIKSIVENEDRQYLEKLDVDILVGATERCFNYSNVDYIRRHTQLIGFEALLKLAQEGKEKKAIELLRRLMDFSLELTPKALFKISKALQELTDGVRDTSKLEFEVREDVLVLDELHAQCRQKANYQFIEGDTSSNPFVTLTVILMGSVMEYIVGRRKSGDETFVVGSEACPRYITTRFKLVDELAMSSSFNDSLGATRIMFYKTILDGDQLKELPLILKTSLANHFYDLAGEVARHYCLQGISVERRKEILAMSLDLLQKERKVNVTFESYRAENITPAILMQGVSSVLKSQTLQTKVAKDFNRLVSRIREVMFELGETQNVLQLSDLALSISSKYGDHHGIILALSYKGNAMFKMGQHEESTTIYLKYFEHLIRSSRNIDDFLVPLEGLLMNSKVTGDNSAFIKCKNELYEHLMYLGSSAISKKLNNSLFDPENTLSSLFRDLDFESDANRDVHYESADDNQLINDVLSILVGISYADGELDDTEMYDLRESCVALSRSLNIDENKVLQNVEEVCEAYSKLSSKQRVGKFAQSCEQLCAHQERSFTLTVLSLCIDMSKADGFITETEQELIDIARKSFENHTLN